jgi:L-rhamnose mutarotase
MRRFGQTLGLRSEKLEEYERYHEQIWPEIEHAIREAGIRNYSIFHLDGVLFAYYEYHGPDDEYDERMRALAEAPRMRDWWDIMEPMQIPHPARPEGSWWIDMPCVFHQS